MPERRRQLGILFVVILTLGLATFAILNVMRWQKGGGIKDDGVGLKRVTLANAPLAVQEAAARLSDSRVAYTMPMGNTTYLIMSTGPKGERIELAQAERQTSPARIAIHLRSSSTGDQIIVASIKRSITDARMIYFLLDSQAAQIPALINTDNLPLVDFPDKDMLVMVSPQIGSRVGGSSIEVSGYARVFEGQFSVQVFSAGKGRILGQVDNVRASIGAPNWGSFRVSVPVEIPAGMVDGVVVVHDQVSGAKAIIPIRFGSK